MAKKRVHELAKQYDMPSAEVLKRLAAAGIEVKAAASAVDEDAADRALTGKPQLDAEPSTNGAGQETAAADGDAAKSAPKRPTRSSLQGERAPGAGGGVRRVVIDSQASRRPGPSAARRAAAAAGAVAPTSSRCRRTRRASSRTRSG